MADLKVAQTVPNGPVKPGTSFDFFLHRGGNVDDVPDTGFQWTATLDGKALTSEHTVAQLGHTMNRKALGFQLKSTITRGQLQVTGHGHGLSFSSAYQIQVGATAGGGGEPATKADLAAMEARLAVQISALAK